MTSMQSNQKVDYVGRYRSLGEERFHKYLLSESVQKILRMKDGSHSGTSPEIELLDHSEKFLQLYRRKNDIIHLDLARLFRRAAHRVYRILIRMQLTKKNDRFLNLASAA